MEDHEIVALYWARDEQAIKETDMKYGSAVLSVSQNLLGSREDAEECVNDTYLAAWNSMPEERPEKLRAWLLKVVRNLSINRYRHDHAGKRYDGMEILLSELEDCVPSRENVEREIEAAETGEIIDRWLKSLDSTDRRLFVRRYFDGEALNTLANDSGMSQNRLAKRMFRLRKQLKAVLEKEEIFV